MEGLPEFGVLQVHPDAALQVGVGAGSHGGGRGAAEVGLQVWKVKKKIHHNCPFSEEDKDSVELLSPLRVCMLQAQQQHGEKFQIQSLPSALLLHVVPEGVSRLQSPAERGDRDF